MNILVSWKWLGEYVDLRGLTPEDVAARVSLSGPGIEKIIPQGQELAQVVVGRILAIEPHPQADKLRIAKVDAGGKPLTIVCGGSNIAVGQWVPVALIGARVRWHGEGEPIELKPIEIRGVASEGMICAANEIGLAEAFPHGEREILDLGLAIPGDAWTPGTPLAEALGLADDFLLDSEVTTNRPDMLGMVGFAREVAAILGREFKEPQEKPIQAAQLPEISLRLEGERDGKPLCSRFCAVRIRGVHAATSPWWMKRRLVAAGVRPVNVLIDITNYVLLEWGQPMHAYDADRLQGGLRVAPGIPGESFEALNGTTYVLDPSMPTVRDEVGPVALAGIIGGQRAAVDAATATVLFEAATFDEVSIRRTARALDVATEAAKAFEKGLSSYGPLPALRRAVELCLALAGGEIASGVADIATPRKVEVFSLPEAQARSLMGLPMAGEEMQALLERLGFSVQRQNGVLTAEVPWWRDHDIEDGRDLVEEIARLHGYANMQPVFPAGMSPVPSDPAFAFEDRLRALAKGFGFTELMGYSFVSREQLERVQIDPETCLRLANPLSRDGEFMRPSLGPSLLQAIVENQERAAAFRVFELSTIYWQNRPQPALPEERAEIVFAVVNDGPEPWVEAKGVAEALLQELNILDGAWQRWGGDHFWHPGRSSQCVLDGQPLVTVGELHPQMAERWGIARRVGLVQAFPAELARRARPAKPYQPIPAFPEIERDLAVVVDEGVEIAAIEAAARTGEPTGLLRRVTWFDAFRGEALGAGKKSLAFHLAFRADDRTLSSEEVDRALDGIRRRLEKAVGAAFRG